MDDNTNANMIYSNLQSKEQIVKSRSNTKDLLILASLLGFHGPPQHPLHCIHRVAHLCHHFFFLGELYHLALHGCSSDLSKEPLLLIEDLFITHFLLYMFSAELLFTAWQGVAFFWSILRTLLKSSS